jgi:hypothetical protein
LLKGLAEAKAAIVRQINAEVSNFVVACSRARK